MIDTNKLIDDFNKYSNYKKYFKFYKTELFKYYKKNIDVLDIYLEKYYDSTDDKDEVTKLLNEYPELKTYMDLKILKEHFEDKMKEYRISSTLLNIGLSAIIKDQDTYILYDLDNEKKHILHGVNEKIINYIVSSLDVQGKYVSIIERKDLPLIKVLYDDYKSVENDKMRNRIIKSEYEKAKDFDNIMCSKNEELKIEKIDKKLKELLIKFKNNEIDSEEYITMYYYYLILRNRNPEEIYNTADLKHKSYIINAYIRLSSLPTNSEEYARTSSEIINKAVLIRKKHDR